MSANNFGLLDEKEENELHKSRLLNVEEKPFKRITKRLIAPGAFTNPNPQKLPSPPPDGGPETADASAGPTSLSVDTAQLKEDIILDFAAFDAAVTRLQFLASANAAERERYAQDRVRILETMDSVRDSNAQLRAQLEEAKATLAQRKKFDELADKITSNRMLKPRSEQEANLEKLAEECEELQRESETYGETWRERRGQFQRIVEEGERLRKLIKDEKEEVERREGMDEGAEEDGEAVGVSGSGSGGLTTGNGTPARGTASGNVTPMPNSGQTSAHGHIGIKGDDAGTPRPVSRDERTPRPDSPAGGGGDTLKPRLESGGSFSRSGSQAPGFRAGSAAPREEPEEGEDVEMGESTQQADTPMAEGVAEENPQITVESAQGTDNMDTT